MIDGHTKFVAQLKPGILLRCLSPKSKENLLKAWKDASGLTSFADFGTPTAATAYRLCLFAGGALLFGGDVPAGSDWHAQTNGFTYKNTGSAPDGIGPGCLLLSVDRHGDVQRTAGRAVGARPTGARPRRALLGSHVRQPHAQHADALRRPRIDAGRSPLPMRAASGHDRRREGMA